ncbi:MAG: cyclic nucleotide-binding domain-containing protein, partial [Prochlorococcus sp.]
MTNDSHLLIAKQGWLAAHPSSLQDSLRAHLQWVRYRTGQPLLQADRLPHQVMIIAEGAVRLVADDPATGPFSLARLGVGDALGWCGLVRGQPTETAIAMEPSLVAAIPARQFLSLLASDPALRQACLEPDRTELAELLLAWLAHQPQHYEDLPGLVAEMWRPGAVRVITGEELQQASSLDPGWLWLPSAPLAAADPIGIAIERWLPDSLEHSGASLPLGPRLLGLSRSALKEALQLRAVMPHGEADVNAAKEFWQQAREADELPDPIDPRDLGLSNSSLRLPPLTERGEGPLESAMVCLNRLAGRYHFP